MAPPGTRAGDTLRHAVRQPIAVVLPPEPRSHCLALEARAQRPDAAISLDFVLPFCAAHCLCCDRDIPAAQPEEVIDDAVDGLIEELRTVAGRIGGPRDVLQLRLGVGSASELDDVQLVRLVQAVRAVRCAVARAQPPMP